MGGIGTDDAGEGIRRGPAACLDGDVLAGGRLGGGIKAGNSRVYVKQDGYHFKQDSHAVVCG